MPRVTRVVQAMKLTKRKLTDLKRLADALALVRAYVWRKYGSISGVSKTKFDIHKEVWPIFQYLNIGSHVIGRTILDAADDIQASREASKAEVRKYIFSHAKNEAERKRLFSALKVDRSGEYRKSWTEDKYLRRMMRKLWKHGVSHCDNQIVFQIDCFKWFEKNGRGFLDVCGFISKKSTVSTSRGNKLRRIAIPLSANVEISGQIRVIINGDAVAVHYGFEVDDVDSCGVKTIGVDKGYTEVFVDSDGESYGYGLGEILTKESNELKAKHRARHKIRAIAEKSSPAKKARIEKNNLGREKLGRRKENHKQKVSTICHRAAHAAVDKAAEIAVEDLKKPFASKKARGANANRRLGGWVKGVIASALNDVASRRCASVKLVNAAYTSQICCDCGCFGKRTGDTFHCEVCRDVKRSDHVSAKNVLARLNDKEIKLYTPYRQVKEILLARASSRLRLSNLDSSCAEVVGAVNGERITDLHKKADQKNTQNTFMEEKC